MSEVTPISSANGSFLCTLSLFRMPDGSIRTVVDDMPNHVIEAEPTITARFFRVADWSFQGALDLMRQGVRFCEEHRAENEP